MKEISFMAVKVLVVDDEKMIVKGLRFMTEKRLWG